jgi:hypothetical protein
VTNAQRTEAAKTREDLIYINRLKAAKAAVEPLYQSYKCGDLFMVRQKKIINERQKLQVKEAMGWCLHHIAIMVQM